MHPPEPSLLGGLWRDRVRRLVGSRGRGALRLVRTGAVAELELADGCITAEVGPAPIHRVRVHLAPPGPSERERVTSQRRDSPAAWLELLAGTPGEALVWVLADPITGLLPRRNGWGATCTCPALRQPCVHAAAVLLAVGTVLDGSPGALLRLRGLGALPAPAHPFADAELEALFGISLAPAPLEIPPTTPLPPPAPEAPLPSPESSAREVHPLEQPCPPAVGLVDAVVVSLLAALHGAHTLEDAHLFRRRQRALGLPILHHPDADPRALARLLPFLEGEATLRAWTHQALASSAPRESLRRRVDRARAAPTSPLPDVQLQPTPSGGLFVVGRGAGVLTERVEAARGGADRRELPATTHDPERLYQPFRRLAAELLHAAGHQSPAEVRRWRAGPGLTQRGLKALFPPLSQHSAREPR